MDAGAPDWTSLQVLTTDGGIVVERVKYASDGFQVFAEVCRPVAPGAHPTLLRNHGGFSGLGAWSNDEFCRAAAGNGYIVASASYRGEDGSEGPITVCSGEVTDVQNLKRVLERKPYSDGRFFAFGYSHGGCISLELSNREPTLKGVVDFFGPGDWEALYGWWKDQLDAGAPLCPGNQASCTQAYQTLIALTEAGADGGPGQNPRGYAERSPTRRLHTNVVPLLTMQGTTDVLVDADQACGKQAALVDGGRPLAAWYLDATLKPKSTTRCGGQFSSSPPYGADGGPAFGSQRTVSLVFEGQGHGFSGAADSYSAGMLLQWILTWMPPDAGP